MILRSVTCVVAAACLAVLVGLPAPAVAGPGLMAKPSAGPELVQETGYYKRRWRTRDGPYVRDSDRDTFVAAPFARVYSGRYGTWVRAPFVNLWVPR